jgi:hypothetical protein
MHLCVLCFNLVSPELKRECGHVFHKRCIHVWKDFYDSACPLCPLEHVLFENNMTVAWDFVVFVDNRNPEILQSFFKEDDNATGVLFDLLNTLGSGSQRLMNTSPIISVDEVFSLRGFSHPVFLTLVAYVARTSPMLVAEFSNNLILQAAAGCDPSRVRDVCSSSFNPWGVQLQVPGSGASRSILTEEIHGFVTLVRMTSRKRF